MRGLWRFETVGMGWGWAGLSSGKPVSPAFSSPNPGLKPENVFG